MGGVKLSKTGANSNLGLYWRRYFKNSFLLNLPYVVLFLTTFFTLPIVLRNIPKQDYGLYAFVFAFEEWLVSATGLNITAGMKKGIANGLDGTFIFALLKRFYILSIVGLVLSAVSFYLIYFKQKIIMGELFVVLAVYAITGALLRPMLIEFLVAKKAFKALAVWKVVLYTLPYLISAYVAFISKDVVLYTGFQLGGISFLSFVGCLFLFKRFNLVQRYKEKRIDRQCYEYGLKLIPVDIISVFAFKLSSFIIGPLFGYANLAIYSVAETIRGKSSEMIKNFRSLFYADFAKLADTDLKHKLRRNFKLMFLFSAGISALLMIAGCLYIYFFLPSSYHEAIIYFIILGVSFPASILDIVLQTSMEAHLKHKELAIRRVIPDLIKIVIILGFGLKWKIIGVCFGVAISMWVGLTISYYLTLKDE